MKDHSAAAQCVKAYKVDKISYDQSYLSGKQIKVEFQDDNKRRKDSKYYILHSAKVAITVAKWVISQGNAMPAENVYLL